MAAKSGDAAAADAKKLQDTFAQVHAYWQKKNVSDATQFAMDAENGFKEVGKLAAAGKFRSLGSVDEDAGELRRPPHGAP